MRVELRIPEVGESITEVQISEWLKTEGEKVEADESLAVIDSEKTTFELPAPAPGRLARILHKAGDTVRVGEVVAHLESDGEPPQASAAEVPEKPKPKAKPEPALTSAEQTRPKEVLSESEPAAAPPRELPKDESSRRPEPEAPEPSRKAAAGPSPPRPASSKPKPPPTPARPGERPERVVPMTMLRRTVARRLVEAQQTMAMLTTFNEVDMSAVQALRKEHGERFEQRYQVRLGLMSFFMKAATGALQQFPKLNAEIHGRDIVYRSYVDMGLAIASERGLVVAVLRNAEALSFAELERATADFARRAREGKLQPEDLEGGTFTITNGGVFGSLLSTPIINPPQTGILGLHTIQERPVAVAGQVVIRPMMYVALTYDHRLVDGHEAVLFLRRIKEAIENPARMLIEI